jgi:hypothetical protein
MALTLKETQVIGELAGLLYAFLPGQAHPFAGVANDVGVAEFWQGGSKRPAITALLENTLDRWREKLCSLLLETVRRGVNYRNNKGMNVTREEIQKLNELVRDLGFKIPELWDESFLSTLPRGQLAEEEKPDKIDPKRLKELCDTFLSLEKLSSQQKGFEFERFLNELFGVFGLHPRGPFRLQGEQTDGSIDFENHTYLIEAKFQFKPIGQQDLLAFRGKVEGKATRTRLILCS